MQTGQTLWTREEILLALNLYIKTPFGRLHKGNPDVIALAQVIGRTPSSVALKLVNLASLDPDLKARGIKGASNASKLDKAVWDEFFQQSEETYYESEVLAATLTGKAPLPEEQDFVPMAGKERLALVKARVNQRIFRESVFASYQGTCAISGIKHPSLLVASHIVPWRHDKVNRLHPSNGICLNGLYDKAFDAGLFTLSPAFKVILSKEIKQDKSSAMQQHFHRLEGQEIMLPERFKPGQPFLEYHRDAVFRG
jgi:putative restriction endonuclease